MSNEEEARKEIIRSCREWGLTNFVPAHLGFRKRVIKSCVDTFGGKISLFDDVIVRFGHLKKEIFSESFDEAYKHVLLNGLENGKEYYWEYNDRLHVEGFGEPFWRKVFRDGGVSYEKKHQYKIFSNRELDPLDRYEFKKIIASRYWFRQMFLSNFDQILGLVFEAWIACHALKHESCYNCKCKKTLRWAGGVASSWQDLVCTSCDAMFEIKTKASEEKVEKVFHYNNLRVGSYGNFCQLKRRCRPDQKLYLVVLSRASSYIQKRQMHPVYIAEIDKGIPKLQENSFNENKQDSSLKTEVSMKLTTKSKWFDLPKLIKTEAEFYDQQKSAYQDFYSQEQYQLYFKEYFGPTSNTTVVANTATKKKKEVHNNGEKPQTIESIQKELDKLKVNVGSDDDWEKIYESN